ncbi:hypothetical protein SD71_16025 [Cohnella kolymensis]|uniref:Uncharacterized protein n=1 Tax=Cohnella kolymensis TaxID=1590652 RepID=A0ABR5A370_9BACL|nr:hypothetical protein [Cohnella kolymensis]KIL35138.1 hypothetical protein SD71_16025 [Cohnella kolymensis]
MAVIKIGEVEQSIKDLTRIYKPKLEGVDRFVRRYVLKYRIPAGYEKRLKNLVIAELTAMAKQADAASN